MHYHTHGIGILSPPPKLSSFYTQKNKAIFDNKEKVDMIDIIHKSNKLQKFAL